MVRPRLWCGLTSGRLVVYNAETWTQEDCHICAADSIVRHCIYVVFYLILSSREVQNTSDVKLFNRILVVLWTWLWRCPMTFLLFLRITVLLTLMAYNSKMVPCTSKAVSSTNRNWYLSSDVQPLSCCCFSQKCPKLSSAFSMMHCSCRPHFGLVLLCSVMTECSIIFHCVFLAVSFISLSTVVSILAATPRLGSTWLCPGSARDFYP